MTPSDTPETNDNEPLPARAAEGPEPTRAGFIAVLGAPNAGKSTLVNTIIGTKVSIVSPKVQTTRSIVRGIAMEGQSQLIFVDTPGIFKPNRRMERAMVSAAWTGAADADMVMLLVDARRGFSEDVRAIIDGLLEAKRKAVLVINKIDAVPRPSLLSLSAELFDTGAFSDVFMISALKGDGVRDLVDYLAARMPEGPWLFPEDEVSDLPQRLLAAEITREKLFLNLHQELPYSVSIETESWEERKDGSVRIDQIIYVMRDSQRSIVLGKQGAQIKRIGAAARTELEALLERRVHLFLHVKVAEDWHERRDHYTAWGLDFDA
ncbi:GTPase Era [Caenispirillum salinarum]|uniref:GTPase Era n=1 Tax=Caenispirillum salinarum TaxID=859058 RepID=UPI0038504C85